MANGITNLRISRWWTKGAVVDVGVPRSEPSVAYDAFVFVVDVHRTVDALGIGWRRFRGDGKQLSEMSITQPRHLRVAVERVRSSLLG